MPPIKEKNEGRRRPGPPATGLGTPVQVRCQDDLLKSVDDWRAHQRPIPSRPEAIRQLAELGLKRGGK